MAQNTCSAHQESEAPAGDGLGGDFDGCETGGPGDTQAASPSANKSTPAMEAIRAGYTLPNELPVARSPVRSIRYTSAMTVLRLRCSSFGVDVRLRELNGRWIASADTHDGPSLGLGFRRA
jgi:hypothetical protein